MFLFCCLSFITLQGQNEINSPYSSYGIGDINHSSNGMLDAMGGASYGMQSPYFINFRNPASYAAFDSLSFIADVGASVFVSTLAQKQQSQQNTYMQPGYLALGLPVTQHWRTSLGILPFSSVGYDIEKTTILEDIGEVTYNYNGSGGIYQLYWGNAFKICKGLSIGFNASYLFGTIYNYQNAAFEGSNYTNTLIADAIKIKGIYLDAGLQYMFNIGEDHRIGLGVIYSNTAYIWAKENLLINSYSGVFVETSSYDTVWSEDGISGRLNIPQSIGGGVSYSYKNKLTVAADVTWQNFAKFQFLQPSTSMKNTLSGSLGLQFIQDPYSSRFFKKMAFRLGGKYSTGNLELRNKPITEFGVCLGVGVPLNTFNTHSSINLMFEYGKKGTLANDLVLQNYFRVSFSFSLQERWYQRVKLD
jgi:hypothetical protein